MANEDPQIMNADMNVLLLQSKVFPVLEWDSAIVDFVQTRPGSAQFDAFSFLSDTVKKCLYSAKIFTHECIPEIIKLLTAVTSKSDPQS